MRKYVDVLLALFIAGLSAVVGVVSYRYVSLDFTSSHSQPRFVLGHHEFGIESRGKCAGTLAFDATEEPGVKVLSKGTVRLGFPGGAIDSQLFLGAYFNPLDQLVAANGRITIDKSYLEIRLRNTHPIRVEAEIKLLDRSTVSSLTMPGPILLRRHGDELQLDFSSVLGPMAQLTSGKVELTGVEDILPVVTDLAQSACARESGENASLPVVFMFEKLMAKLPFAGAAETMRALRGGTPPSALPGLNVFRPGAIFQDDASSNTSQPSPGEP